MFDEELRELDRRSLRRSLRTIDSATGPLVTIDGRTLILLASNNYLGLATHPAVTRAAVAATERYGAGAGASRLVCGTLPPHRELETALARFKGTESALTFGSGYLANLGLIPALAGSRGLILADRLCHASLLDGCRVSGAEFHRYHHRDPAHLERLLRKRPPRRKTVIVTDGVFSMDGDLAPLPELTTLSERYHAALLVDDAHGTGVLGATGRGTVEHFGVEARIPFHMGTLSKALGGSGAYVVGPDDLIQYLVNTARSFVYTTAPPPATAAAAAAALEVVRAHPELQTTLWRNRDHFLGGLKALGFRTTDTGSPIISILVGEAPTALSLADHLFRLGVYAPAIRPPTVPPGTSRIRTAVTASHTIEQLDRALAVFRAAGQELRLI